MAIQYVGSQTMGRSGSVSTQSNDYTLTGGLGEPVPAAGDLVVVALAVGAQGRTPLCRIVSPATWTELGLITADGTTYDTNLNISYKFMPGTPDTDFVSPATGHIDDGQRWTVHVYRGVDPVTPLDVTPTTATGTGTGRGNPPSITPVTPGACVLIATANAAATAAGQSSPGGMTAFLTGTATDVNDVQVSTGHVLDWASGAVDIAAYTTGSNNAADSWAAYARCGRR